MQNTNGNEEYIRQLSESLVDEVVGAVGLPKTRLSHWLMWKLINPVTERFAHVGINFERIIKENGFPAASEWVLSLFCNPVKAHFQTEIPADGPLLVAANHPGAYDSIMYASQLNRKDINLIATEIPYLRLLPRTSTAVGLDRAVDLPSNTRTSRKRTSGADCSVALPAGTVASSSAITINRANRSWRVQSTGRSPQSFLPDSVGYNGTFSLRSLHGSRN